MNFRAFMARFSPPLTNDQVDEIVAEHDRLINETNEAKPQPVATEEG